MTSWLVSGLSRHHDDPAMARPRASALIFHRRCRLSRCGNSAANLAASDSPAPTETAVPHKPDQPRIKSRRYSLAGLSLSFNLSALWLSALPCPFCGSCRRRGAGPAGGSSILVVVLVRACRVLVRRPGRARFVPHPAQLARRVELHPSPRPTSPVENVVHFQALTGPQISGKRCALIVECQGLASW